MQIGDANIRLRPDLGSRAFLTGAAIGGAAAWRLGVGQTWGVVAPSMGPKIALALTAASFGVIAQNAAHISHKDPSVKNLALTAGVTAGASGIGAALLGAWNGRLANRLLERPDAIVKAEAAANALRYAKFGVGVGLAVGVGVAIEELASHAFKHDSR